MNFRMEGKGEKGMCSTDRTTPIVGSCPICPGYRKEGKGEIERGL